METEMPARWGLAMMHKFVVALQAQRFQKLLVENFTRRDRSHSILFDFCDFLMIVHNFNVMADHHL
jgi:hypothetical protein